MKFTNLKHTVEQYYTRKFKDHGPTHAGVDWNSNESQNLRFDQLLKVCDVTTTISINDLGCGYGALYDYLVQNKYDFRYAGYDLSQSMIDHARNRHASKKNCIFCHGDSMDEADYSVASGIFNVKMDKSDDEWQEYILDTLTEMNMLSRRGFAFNVLTKYSDREYMKDNLYYADPCFFFDYCKLHFAKNVALLHDYGLYEFTILVRKG